MLKKNNKSLNDNPNLSKHSNFGRKELIEDICRGLNYNDNKKIFLELTNILSQIDVGLKQSLILISAYTKKTIFVSNNFQQIWGVNSKSLNEEENIWLDCIPLEERHKAIATIETKLRADYQFEEEFSIKNNRSRKVIDLTCFPIANVHGEIIIYATIIEDITQTENTDIALKKSEEKFRNFFESSQIGMATIDRYGNFLEVNKTFCNYLGYKKEEIYRLSLNKISIDKNDKKEFLLKNKLIDKEISSYEIEKTLLTKNNDSLNTLITYNLNPDNEKIEFFIQILDISERKLIENKIIQNPLTDFLTLLPNRNLLLNRLEQLVKRTQKQKNKKTFAILIIDIDRFKNINDDAGRSVGDLVLCAFSNRLKEIVNDNDTVARLTADEFAILIEETTSNNLAAKIADKIEQSYLQPFIIAEHEIFITASIGIFHSQDFEWADHCNSNKLSVNEIAEVMLQNTTIAMFGAKKEGIGIKIYDRFTNKKKRNRTELEAAMRKSIIKEDFQVYYQPIFNLHTQELYGFEALMRWNHPKKGFISPSEFIPVCEETRLIIPLGTWLLEKSCQTTKKWIEQYNLPDLKISVNLSALQFKEPQFTAKVNEILASSQLPGKNLKLEITESTFINDIENNFNDPQSVKAKIEKLMKSNIEFSIDDFGTGYSSFSYLHTLPINTLKIDRSFVNNLDSEKSKNTIKAIITLAHQLELNVIAEGIETKTQKDFLKQANCEYGQGYYFAQPLNESNAARLLQEKYEQ